MPGPVERPRSGCFFVEQLLIASVPPRITAAALNRRRERPPKLRLLIRGSIPVPASLTCSSAFLRAPGNTAFIAGFCRLFFCSFPNAKTKKHVNDFCVKGSKNAKVHFENASFVTWLLQSRTLCSVCRVAFLWWFWEPCNYISVMGEKVCVGYSCQRLQLLLTERETGKESLSCSWHRYYSRIARSF